jgi:hypothetical protein
MNKNGLIYTQDYSQHTHTTLVTKSYVDDNVTWVDDREERKKKEKIRDRKSKIKSILIEILNDKVKKLENENKAIWKAIEEIKTNI